METDSYNKQIDLVFSGKTITTKFYPEDQVLTMVFDENSSGTEFRKAWHTTLENIKTLKINLLLLDETFMRIYPKELDWLMKEQLPQFLQDADKKIKLAIVLSKNYYESVLTEDYHKKLTKSFPEKLQSKLFRNFDLAKAWLTNKPLNNERVDAHNILRVMMLDRIKFSFTL